MGWGRHSVLCSIPHNNEVGCSKRPWCPQSFTTKLLTEHIPRRTVHYLLLEPDIFWLPRPPSVMHECWELMILISISVPEGSVVPAHLKRSTVSLYSVLVGGLRLCWAGFAHKEKQKTNQTPTNISRTVTGVICEGFVEVCQNVPSHLNSRCKQHTQSIILLHLWVSTHSKDQQTSSRVITFLFPQNTFSTFIFFRRNVLVKEPYIFLSLRLC